MVCSYARLLRTTQAYILTYGERLHYRFQLSKGQNCFCSVTEEYFSNVLTVFDSIFASCEADWRSDGSKRDDRVHWQTKIRPLPCDVILIARVQLYSRQAAVSVPGGYVWERGQEFVTLEK